MAAGVIAGQHRSGGYCGIGQGAGAEVSLNALDTGLESPQDALLLESRSSAICPSGRRIDSAYEQGGDLVLTQTVRATATEPVELLARPHLGLDEPVRTGRHPATASIFATGHVLRAGLSRVRNRNEYIGQPNSAFRLHGLLKKMTKDHRNQATVNAPLATG